VDSTLALQVGLRPGRRVTMTRAEAANPTDGQLIVRVAAGDHQAFDELHARYQRTVLGLALRRIRDRGRAEDAVQDVFVAVWRSARTYDPDRGSGTPWLYAVARNAITDALRRTPEPTGELSDGPSGDPGPPDEAERSWASWQVHRALEELPEHERPVIELAYWGGLSQSEIADRLAIPLGTVKTRTRSALARLAGALEEELR
jgi:RNA polymerase sigma-70 factor (ECF subfamily)